MGGRRRLAVVALVTVGVLGACGNGTTKLDPISVTGQQAGASAQCRDGTYSHSQHRSGTCADHGGVSRWINRPAS
jgi:uncharacterized protein DUF3761